MRLYAELKPEKDGPQSELHRIFTFRNVQIPSRRRECRKSHCENKHFSAQSVTMRSRKSISSSVVSTTTTCDHKYLKYNFS